MLVDKHEINSPSDKKVRITSAWPGPAAGLSALNRHQPDMPTRNLQTSQVTQSLLLRSQFFSHINCGANRGPTEDVYS